MDDAVYNETIKTMSNNLMYSGTLDYPDCEATLNNSLCGDQVTIQLCLEDQHIAHFRYQVRGCMLCKASASVLASRACGMTLCDIVKMRKSLVEAIRASSDEAVCQVCHEIFRPIRKHRSRHSCVLLPYDAAIQSLSSLVLRTDDHKPTDDL